MHKTPIFKKEVRDTVKRNVACNRTKQMKHLQKKSLH